MSNPKAYDILLKKEKMQKPALITRRNEIIEHSKRMNYKNEYDRIQGELIGHAEKFSHPGGHWQKDKLINRQQMLKKLFRESHNPEKHPLEK